MLPTSTPAVKSIEQQVLRIVSQRRPMRPVRLRSRLNHELGLDQLDVVNIILALEQSFHIVIPDEVPLTTVSDFVTYVAEHTPEAANQAA
ncbi:acyl carrier protein [Hymenobacter aerilatus]|uniref:Acyl carrier protein n=1 Tax=Hymenobacter aerilatus TaxID=2932251 RepID=A0A8T9SX85_9BACT|nr:phosphopantetheine-binding protein [Hymenobacter aerilatus]UOR04406.1 acyl carrier protein [Hymenobacter aerilatus]